MTREPTRALARPTGMRALGTALTALALLAVASCGSGTAPDQSADAGATWHGCSAADVRDAGARVGSADLDGDSRADTLRYVRPGQATCSGLVAVTAHGVLGTDLAGLDVDPSSIRPVALQGSEAQALVLVAEKPHPRGGRQVHLFGSDGERLGEVTVDGRPLLPFFATDGGGAPMTATCPPGGGVVVLTAQAHEPPGIILAWDVTRTSYAIDGLTATPQGSRLVKDAAADPTLRQDMPQLYDGSFFEGCDA